MHGPREVPEATVLRLPVYLRILTSLAEQGVDTVSSHDLAEAARVSSAQLRKDLSHLGSYGIRGVGYEVRTLASNISADLGISQDWPVLIVGVGNLGHALANYSGFAQRGFRIVGLVDPDPAVIGKQIAGQTVEPMTDLESLIAARGVSIAVLATPVAVAQSVCDRLVACGVNSILNFAPVELAAPDYVDVRKIDLSIELQVLAYHVQRKAEVPEVDGTEVDGTEVDGTEVDEAARRSASLVRRRRWSRETA